ncbi:hypothetical protein BJF83_02345 [Nocardiopsis sp. CNR-923]|uniref:phosphotransferase n=1 Tax=Nocardiopsis sp. CNR-923 TaxID=1904965 RepID=UPI000959EE78|nr:phosphotransferase [Nocardiopsis sp. CNR-923]OLT27417.1 hypothetical protein BJF83_02345 [Nocardiopsis sp. CNR-923]
MRRFTWAHLPDPAKTAFEAEFGRVRHTTTTPPGLTIGIASRVETERHTVFVKAVPIRSPALPGYRRERAVAEALPAGVPAPRILWVCEGGWLTLVFEYVEGRHVDLASDALAVMRTLTDMRDRLDPSPVPGMRSIDEKLSAFLAAARAALDGPAEEIADVDAYADVVERADLAAFTGTALLHADLTSGNLIHDGDRVWVLDWALSSLGAPWVDVALMVPRLTEAGFSPPEAERWASEHPDWRTAPAHALDLLAVLRPLFLVEKIRTGPSWLADGRREALRSHEAWARHRLRLCT